MLFSGQSVSHFATRVFLYPRQPADVKTSAQFLHSMCGLRAKHFSLVCFCSVTTMALKIEENCSSLYQKKEGQFKNRRKPQPPPQFQLREELSSTDENSTLKDVMETLGSLTSALAATKAKVDSLTTSRASQVATPPEQPGTNQPSVWRTHPNCFLQCCP